MHVKLQLVMCTDDGREETVADIVSLKKDSKRIEHLGLTLAEAKQLLKTIQQRLLAQQVDAFLASQAHCQTCGTKLKVKGYHTRLFRTLFGTFKLRSPRLLHCPCYRRKTTSFRHLSALLTESAAPELLFIETKWASLVSYGLTVDALTDFLPLDATLDVKTVRHDTLKMAERCEAELGEEQWSFIDGCPRDWSDLPIPDGPITVGIDGGYVRDWEAKKRNFEVIVGKSMLAFKRDEAEEIPSSKRFGFVQTIDLNQNDAHTRSCTGNGFSGTSRSHVYPTVVTQLKRSAELKHYLISTAQNSDLTPPFPCADVTSKFRSEPIPSPLILQAKSRVPYCRTLPLCHPARSLPIIVLLWTADLLSHYRLSAAIA
jgi:hypothetical protein